MSGSLIHHVLQALDGIVQPGGVPGREALLVVQ
jgi:hypothetical protein